MPNRRVVGTHTSSANAENEPWRKERGRRSLRAMRTWGCRGRTERSTRKSITRATLTYRLSRRAVGWQYLFCYVPKIPTFPSLYNAVAL